MQVVHLFAQDISCEHCAMAIRRELAGVQGVRVIEIDVAAKVVTVEYENEAALESAMSAALDIGYPMSVQH